jgi:DNA invertase Pin-like site-specific DNA recombinase
VHPLTLVPAAQYLRTSPGVQLQSIDIQKEAIQEYAERAGFVVIRTYIDIDRSGLTLRKRPGLSALLHDIAYGKSDFKAVLVYDVSRWGRFQDADESAHYEFICRQLDVQIHYCAESFANDQGVQSFILKSLKRSMAAEYSRDLSAKCFRGQKHLAEMGFRIGGICGYGLRRMAVSPDGSRTQLLRTGEYKSLSSDRVILVPGPEEEIKTVQEIFGMAMAGKGYTAIASHLNKIGTPYRPTGNWRDFTISRILTSKKYCGWNVWNQSRGRLGTRRTINPSDDWVLVPGAFSPIIEPSVFEQVQKLCPKVARWTREQLLQRLKDLSLRPNTPAPGAPCMRTLQRRLIGFPYLRSHRGTHLKASLASAVNMRQNLVDRRNEIFDELLELFPNSITEFHLPHKSRPVLQLANGMVVSVIVCGRQTRQTGLMRWVFRPASAESKFVTLICLDALDQIRYYLVPRITLRRDCIIGTDNPIFKTGMRLKHLEDFYTAVSAFDNHNPLIAMQRAGHS